MVGLGLLRNDCSEFHLVDEVVNFIKNDVETVENFLSDDTTEINSIEEVERSRELERKREEFRRKIDEKRARMDQMTEAEREDFLFKLRYLRPDAADPEESFINGSQGTRDGAPETPVD